MKVLIKPTHGLLPRPGKGQGYVPDKGERVDLYGPNGAYWRRRIAAGDAVVDEDTETKSAVKAKTKGK